MPKIVPTGELPPQVHPDGGSNRELFDKVQRRVLVSAAAAWEMAIKKTLGRVDFPNNLEEVLRKDHIEVLPIQLTHALAVADLPLHHQDPFDRMQIAQARLERLVMITKDHWISEYDVPVLIA